MQKNKKRKSFGGEEKFYFEKKLFTRKTKKTKRWDLTATRREKGQEKLSFLKIWKNHKKLREL